MWFVLWLSLSSALAADPPAPDADRHGAHRADDPRITELQARVDALVADYATLSPADQKRRLAEIRELSAQLFDVRQEDRRARLEVVKAKVARMEAEIADRDARREEIIDKYVDRQLASPTTEVWPDAMLYGAGVDRSVVLRDDDAIILMVKSVVMGELPKLRYQCYEPMLRDDASLSGSWMLNFTVAVDGSTRAVTADPRAETAPHAQFQACLVEQVSTWRFSPIKAELPVAKSVGFRAE